MRIIKSVAISYFRSIHRLRVDVERDLVVLSGANDAGKSNILKALNLFFNNKTDQLSPLEFYQDFSLRRLDEVRRETIKGKQFIRIEVEFYRPENYKKSLPTTFKVVKKWFRDGSVQEENNLKRLKLPKSLGTARRMLSQFLGRVRFEYIPAIRDRNYFEHVLRNLQETLLAEQIRSNAPIVEAISNLNDRLITSTNLLSEDFVKATGIQAGISLPKEPGDLFRALSVSTSLKGSSARESKISLSLRGDGIQARFISSLLWYIANSSNLFYIWGFEEPENSLEYNMAIDLAQQFVEEYSPAVQIFVTSHSPAFLSLDKENVISYRVYKDEKETTQVCKVHPEGGVTNLEYLSQDLGLLRLQKEFFYQYLERREDLLSAYKRLKEDLAKNTLPVVYVEGKSDVWILEEAWKKLRPDQEKPFVIKACDPLDGVGGGAGGAKTLAKLLSVVQADSSQIVIGVFDYDREGKQGYDRLPKYFEEDEAIQAKISHNRKAAAFVLPIPPGREEYGRYLTLTIEFYFDDKVLELGRSVGLQLAPLRVIERTTTGVQIGEKEMPCKEVKGGKVEFARQVVPSLETAAFSNFTKIFERIEGILERVDI